MKLILIIIFQFVSISIFSQKAYKAGDMISDVTIQSSLNTTSGLKSLAELKGRITIIDFFGTWCIPCMKALPNLHSIKSKYNDVSIILVSNEDENKLRKFIDKRKDVTLPLIIDKGDIFTKLFQPPSYPYTIILGNDSKVIATLQAAELTSDQVEKWLSLQMTAVSSPAVTPVEHKSITSSPIKEQMPEPIKKVLQLSQDFVYASKSGDTTSALRSSLHDLQLSELKSELTTDDEKKAFWINIYNGFTQLLLKQDPGKYKERSLFFKAKQIDLAGKLWSLDEIEHGILRKSKIKWSEGYLSKLFPGKLERALRVNKLDYRIHFSLNCGAKSCPPVAFYKSGTINQQLDVAARSYLSTEVEFDTAANELKLPAIMGWFRGDFGGKKGMRKIIRAQGIIPADSKPRISFRKYDWTLYLDNYKNL